MLTRQEKEVLCTFPVFSLVTIEFITLSAPILLMPVGLAKRMTSQVQGGGTPGYL